MFRKPSTQVEWWVVCMVVGFGVGTLVELAAKYVPFWVYDPRWMLYVVWIGAFSLGPATLAWMLRNRGVITLFLAGVAFAFLVEGLNVLVPGFGWTHVAPFPLIDRPFWRVMLLGIEGGLFVLLVYGITYGIFFVVAKLNKDDDELEGAVRETV